MLSQKAVIDNNSLTSGDIALPFNLYFFNFFFV